MSPTVAAPAGPLVDARSDRAGRWLAELGELLRFPTVSADPRHRPDLKLAAQWLAEHLDGIGLHRSQVLAGPNGGAPSVYAEWLGAPRQPTLLLYGHFDVQPADSPDAWRSPPFEPTVRDGKLFGRGASDDKGQLFTHLKAVEHHLATAGRLPINVKVWLEGEEEIGSPNLGAFLDREGERLRADAALVSDTEMAGPERPAIVYGLRGHLDCELQVRGPGRDLHAGRYGGAVLNPLQALCGILAGLHDRVGRIAIAGFYDQAREPERAERRALARIAPSDERLRFRLAAPLGRGEPGYSAFERMTLRPALTVNGVRGGYTGPGAKAVIPAAAIARLGFRLVPEQEPGEIVGLLRRHVAAATPCGLRTKVTAGGGSRPVVLPRRHAIVAAAARAIEEIWGAPPIFTRSGGSIPVVDQLHRRLGIPVVLLGFGLPSDRAHAPNEHLDLATFFRAVRTVARLLEACAR